MSPHFIIYVNHFLVEHLRLNPAVPQTKTARCRTTIVFHAPFQCLPSLDNVTSCLVIHSSKLNKGTTYPPITFWKTKLYFAMCFFINDFLVFEAVVIRYKAVHNEYTVFSWMLEVCER
jgi:hypothetical protein